MKKYFWNLMAVVAVVMSGVIITACGSDDDDVIASDEVSAETTSVELKAEGETVNVSIFSNRQWNITGAPDWFTVSPNQGSKNSTITISAKANPTSVARTSTLYIKAGDAMTTISVSQKGRPLADLVEGTYSGRLTLGEEVLEDAYIIKIKKLTDNTVAVNAQFFGDGDINFNLSLSGNQIAFTNATLSNFNMYVLGNTVVINYLANGGYMLTYTGTK